MAQPLRNFLSKQLPNQSLLSHGEQRIQAECGRGVGNPIQPSDNASKAHQSTMVVPVQLLINWIDAAAGQFVSALLTA